MGCRAAGSWLAAAVGALLLVCAGCDVEVTARSPTDLHVRWAAPVDDGGQAITKYRVEWDTNGGMQEQQLVETRATSDVTGTFALSFRGQRTAPLAHDVSPEVLQRELQALPTVGAVAVTRSDAPAGSFGYSWTVSFANNVGDLPPLAAHGEGLYVAGAPAPSVLAAGAELFKGDVPAFDQGTVGMLVLPLGSAEVWMRNEVQTITLMCAASDVHGTFRASFMGEVSTIIAYNATAAQMATALESMASVEQVSVTAEDIEQSTVAPVAFHGRQWRVTFTAQPGDVPLLLVSTHTAPATNTASSREPSSSTVEAVTLMPPR